MPDLIIGTLQVVIWACGIIASLYVIVPVLLFIYFFIQELLGKGSKSPETGFSDDSYTVRRTTVNYSSRPLARSPAPRSARTVPVQTPARKPVTHHRYSAASPPPPPPMPKVIPKARSKVPNSPQELLQRQQSKKTKTRVPKTGQRVPVKRALYRQLVNLTKDEATADRLLTLAILKYPERSPDWCCEKVIFDLERDRRA